MTEAVHPERWRVGLDVVQVDTAARFRLHIVKPDDFGYVLLAAVDGDPLGQALAAAMSVIHGADGIAPLPLWCVLCRTRIGERLLATLGIVTTIPPAPPQVTPYAACADCADKPDLIGRFLPALRSRGAPWLLPAASLHVGPEVIQ